MLPLCYAAHKYKISSFAKFRSRSFFRIKKANSIDFQFAINKTEPVSGKFLENRALKKLELTKTGTETKVFISLKALIWFI